VEQYPNDELVTQRTLAADLGVTEETLSRVLRRARESGWPLPPRNTAPGGGYGHWYRRAFHRWWRERPVQAPGRPPSISVQRVRQGVRDGMDVQGIALRWNVPVRAVRRAAVRAGVVIPESKDRRRALVRELDRQNIEPKQIIELTGYPETTVYRILRGLRSTG
jgi:hypothetical protein